MEIKELDFEEDLLELEDLGLDLFENDENLEDLEKWDNLGFTVFNY